ncbi:MAG: MtnX-like HAD-IB family phosphatase [Alicyclobacillus sp.]|nr:MtnX-like HAD-IB family phosphatase [Alicyclobacillus sp.]
MGARCVTKAPVGVFCDFDGTISESDLIVSIGEVFGGEPARALIRRVQTGDLTVRQGVEALFRLIPSHRFPEVVQYARSRTCIRPGFADFVEDVRRRGWRFAVVSGGFDFFVEPALAPFLAGSADRPGSSVDVYCNRIRTDGPFLQVVWAVPCDEDCDGACGLCKPTVMRRYDGLVERRVVVGDGVTDIKAARLADLVMARASLLTACVAEGLPHRPFTTFTHMGDRIADALGFGLGPGRAGFTDV